MVIKVIESTIDSFKDKLKNPFFGTLLLVWILRNREFIFNLLFNNDYDSQKRLVLLSEHFSGWHAFINFLLTISFSLLLLALIYIALNISRFIIQTSERIAKPYILKLFSETNIVSREEFKSVEEQRDYYQKKYSEERAVKLGLQKEFDDYKVNNRSMMVGGPLNTESKVIEKETGHSKMAKHIIETGLSDEFNNLISAINSNLTANLVEKKIGKEALQKFLQKNVIRFEEEQYRDDYVFTDFGKKIRDYYLNNLI